MARQKEHLAQAQIAHRMQHIQGPHQGFAPGGTSQGGQLHRHSSAQSLHSQPSFGSITSPGGFQASPTQAPASGTPAGFFDNSFRNPQAGLGAVGAGVDSLGHITEEEIPSIMNRLNLGNRSAQPNQFGAPGQPFSQQQQSQDAHAQQVQQMLQDRARLNEEQARQTATEQDQDGQQVPNERLQEFQQLQEEASQPRFQAAPGKQTNEQPSQSESSTTESSIGSPAPGQAEQAQTKEPLTLTEQVQKAASAKQSPAPTQQAWAKVDSGIPQPFPPAPSQSPLPAPAAQRTSRQTVAEHLNAESRSRSQTPSTDAPTTVAPWAKEPAGPPKGPSLKEIQEAEAKKAAEQEVVAAAARRAALQKELELQTAMSAAPPAPGLPSSSTWAATSSSPVPSGASAWAKAAQPKPTSSAAKSMAQIQKEEEARKRRVAAAAAQAQAVAMASVPSPAGGKSYANLAGKVMPASAQAPAAPGSSAWTTVGAGGKTKLPAAPSPAPAARAPNSTVLPAVQTTMSSAVKKAPSRSATLTGSGAVNAQEEFRKWAINELRPDLNPGLTGKSMLIIIKILNKANLTVHSRTIRRRPHLLPRRSRAHHRSRPRQQQHHRLSPLRRRVHPPQETRRQGPCRHFHPAQER
jgi:PERQ amino acid-rich with GYF domain-containing protein